MCLPSPFVPLSYRIRRTSSHDRQLEAVELHLGMRGTGRRFWGRCCWEA
jgi:hypothetical protein